MQVVLQTKRMLLRTLEDTDIQDLCDILQDAETMTAYEHAFENWEVLDWLRRQQQRYRDDGVGLWACIEAQTGAFLGQAGLTMQPCDGETVLEIGYLFKRQYWHHGYATEAAIACKEYAFSVLGAQKVYSIIRTTNLPSQRVALRNGMKKEKQIQKFYYNMWMPHDVYCVSRPKEESSL